MRVSRIANTISLKRFLTILRYLHINNNENAPKKGDPNFDKLYKLKPMMTHLNQKFKEIFSPARQLSIDESMVGFKGRSSLKQYMPMKPTKRGFKIWVMACAKSDYMLSFKISEGKGSEYIKGTLGERTVLTLNNYLNKGYCLFFDNFLSTFPLLNKLIEKDTFACGTFRCNRKYHPRELLADEKSMKLGDSDFAMSVDSDLSVSKWCDRGKKSVVIISSFHDPSVSKEVLRTNRIGVREDVKCPHSIAEYNAFMGGVDLFDQLHSIS
ncbi:hypothetical protein JTB14_027542 [Gonioctena quinquepunctata]|nr:hypothetical protein JTB14_027542 [Gonioctena quinquepunctata]